MKKIITLLILLVLLTVSCNRVKKKTKEIINKSGETVGKTTTEFIEGVSQGIDKTLQCEIILSQELQNKGLKTGKFSIENSTTGGENDLLILYIIFGEDFKSSLAAKVYDKEGLEIGRTKLEITAKMGNAAYYDFKFDKRTYIEKKSKICIE